MKSSVLVELAYMNCSLGKSALIAPNNVTFEGRLDGMGYVRGCSLLYQHFIGSAAAQNEVSSMYTIRKLSACMLLIFKANIFVTRQALPTGL